MDLRHFFDDIDVEFIEAEAAHLDAQLPPDFCAMHPQIAQSIGDSWFYGAGGRLRKWGALRNVPRPLARLASIYLWRRCQDALGHPANSEAAEALGFQENISLWEQAVLDFDIRPCWRPGASNSGRL